MSRADKAVNHMGPDKPGTSRYENFQNDSRFLKMIPSWPDRTRYPANGSLQQ
jgi:hypothetical protein